MLVFATFYYTLSVPCIWLLFSISVLLMLAMAYEILYQGTISLIDHYNILVFWQLCAVTKVSHVDPCCSVLYKPVSCIIIDYIIHNSS